MFKLFILKVAHNHSSFGLLVQTKRASAKYKLQEADNSFYLYHINKISGQQGGCSLNNYLDLLALYTQYDVVSRQKMYKQ